MTEITRVPLQPIAKGSLSRLWLGVAAGLLAAGGIGWAAMPVLVDVKTIMPGEGPMPTPDQVVMVNYVGKLANGKVFDQGQRVPMDLQTMIPGFQQGLVQMRPGGKYSLHIPASLAYGDQDRRNPATGEVVIPRNSDLDFEVEVMGAMSQAEYQQFMQFQQMMQMQQMQGGPGGHDGPPMPGPGHP